MKVTINMPSSSEVTFVIPVFNLEKYRIDNLKFILPYIQKTGCRILVVEQIGDSNSILGEHINCFYGVEHVLFKTEEKRFHKTGIINYAVFNHVNTKYVWVNDADFYMRFEEILQVDWISDFIQPYEIAKKLNSEDSNKILSGEKLNVEFYDKTVKYISLYGALSFIFNVDSFISIGAMDESIYGWGFEDVELSKRVNAIHTVQQVNIRGIHLWHPIDPAVNWEEHAMTLTNNHTGPKMFDINTYFDKIYCINLASRPDRWEQVNRQFLENNIIVEKFTAVSESEITDDQFKIANPKNITGNNASIIGLVENKRALGCLLSHLSVIEDAKRNGYKKILIFEDDIFIGKYFFEKLKLIEKIKWKILYLGASQFTWSNINFIEEFYLAKNTRGTFAYAVAEDAYDDIIEYFHNPRKSADNLLIELQEKWKNECFVFYPNIVISSVEDSNIRSSMSQQEYSDVVRWDLSNFFIPRKRKKILLAPDVPEFWSINNYFDEIYCINLNKRLERWENLERQLKLANINVTRFQGIDGENLPLKNSLLSGELGCLFSHIEVIKDAKRNAYQKILILEDDIILPKTPNKVLEEIKNIPWDWKLLYLGASQLDWADIELTEKKYYNCKNTNGTFAYGIDCSLFDEIIEAAQKFNKPIDTCLIELQSKYKENSFVLYPNLIISDTRTSDIREPKDIFNYAQQVKWNLYDFSLFNNNIKKILLLPDARDWAFDNIGKAIVKYNPYPDKIYYSINYTRDLHLKKTTINPNDWDLIYIMFEGERLIPPAKNIIRGCYSAFWLEYPAFTPEFISTYFSQCAGAVFANPELHRLFKPHLPSTFTTEIIHDSSDEFLFYPIKHKKNKEFTAIYVGNTKRPVKNFEKIQNICATAGINLHVCKNIPNKELVHEYNKADILINFSDFEGGPQTFVEASLCEVPTIIRDTNELSKIIPCYTGKTEEDFVKILNYLKNNREECAQKGFEAYNVVINNLTYKKTASKFANYFLSFCKTNLKEKLTVFVIHAGNNPNYVDCIKALEEQKCTFQLKIIENVAPMSKAFQRMIDDCETEYYIQVDSDMILQNDAIQTIYNALIASDKNISTVAHMLKDSHLDFNIYGIKGYKHNVLKKYPYNLEIISCEVEQVRRLQKDGYQTLMINKVLGLHSPKWSPSLIYERYFDLIEKWKNFKYDWMNELPSKLLQIFKENPTEINFYALAGAMVSLSTETPLRNREKNFLIEDSNFERIKRSFEERTFKYMVNKETRTPEVLSREHMFGNNKQ